MNYAKLRVDLTEIVATNLHIIDQESKNLPTSDPIGEAMDRYNNCLDVGEFNEVVAITQNIFRARVDAFVSQIIEATDTAISNPTISPFNIYPNAKFANDVNNPK